MQTNIGARTTSSPTRVKHARIEPRSQVLTLLLFFAAVLLAVLPPRHARAYDFGVVPQFEPRRLQAIWEPILNEVEQRSGVPLKLRMAPSIPAFEKAFAAGEYDFAYMNPYHLIIANRLQGYVPLVRDTGAWLYGVIVVRRDSPIQSVEELDGQVVAFPAPNALGAALILRAEFATTYGIKVRPQYVKSHTSVYLNVALGQAAAGGGVQKTLAQQPPDLRDMLRILHATTQMAPHPVAAHPRVDPWDVAAVKKTFLELEKDPQGRELLLHVPIQSIGEAAMADYAPLLAMGLDAFYLTE